MKIIKYSFTIVFFSIVIIILAMLIFNWKSDVTLFIMLVLFMINLIISIFTLFKSNKKQDIQNYLHKFQIGGMEIVLCISCKDGFWSCKTLKGNTGMGNCSGGMFKNLNEYIKYLEKEHLYSYQFFKLKNKNENT